MLDDPIFSNSIDDPIFSKKKYGLQKLKAKHHSLGCGKICDSVQSEKKDMDVAVPVTKSAKKHHLSLITPTIHTKFSFTIIYLLSAVRAALITPQTEQVKLSSLTIDEIVHRVRLMKGEPSILETKEPVQDLVRGILNIFSSKTTHLGTKDWKALTDYEKASKKWSWIGPIFYKFRHNVHIEEEITSEVWGIPHITLVKLVDCFANWLKQVQKMLQQIGNLPSAPVMLMQPTNMYGRFKDPKALRSLSTLNPSCDEVRAYFHKEEALKYTIPERAFFLYGS